MSEAIILALIALVGSLGGSFFGVLASNNKTQYRIEQLEIKVDKHNNVVERVYKLEQHEAILDEKVAVANHRIDDLEKINFEVGTHRKEVE